MRTRKAAFLLILIFAGAGCVSPGSTTPKGAYVVPDLSTFDPSAESVADASPLQRPDTHQLAEDERGIAVFNQPKGSFLLHIQDRPHYISGVNSMLLLTGAFLNGSKVMPAHSPGGMFFERLLYPGTSELAYTNQNIVVKGDVAFAVDEGRFAAYQDVTINQFIAKYVPGLIPKDIMLLVSYQMPPGATALALAIKWQSRDAQTNLVSFSAAVEKIRGLSAPIALQVLAESEEAQISYFGENTAWNLIRFPNGSRALDVRDQTTVPLGPAGTSFMRQASYRMAISKGPSGWTEYFFIQMDDAAAGQYCYAFNELNASRSECVPYAMGQGTNALFPLLLSVEPKGGGSGFYELLVNATLQSGIRRTNFYVVQTGLDVAVATGLAVDSYFYAYDQIRTS